MSANILNNAIYVCVYLIYLVDGPGVTGLCRLSHDGSVLNYKVLVGWSAEGKAQFRISALAFDSLRDLVNHYTVCYLLSRLPSGCISQFSHM